MTRMTSRIGILMIACATLALAGCATAPFPVAGVWTQDVRVPVDGRMPSGSKQGQACAQSWFGVFATGDASVEAAAANGGISNVRSVEALVNARIIFGKYCTVVHGS